MHFDVSFAKTKLFGILLLVRENSFPLNCTCKTFSQVYSSKKRHFKS